MTSTIIPHPALYTDLYQLTMGQGYFKTGTHKKEACFDYYFRKAPFDGSFVIFAGLADLLPALESMRFTADEREWLMQQGFESDFCEFLKNYRFDGTITSLREGEVTFPGEPVLSVAGPLISCQLVETIILNVLNFQSLIATKACRVRLASRDRKVVDYGLRRGQGVGALSATRAAVIGGADATSNVLAGFQHKIPVSGTMAHSWVQSFDTELEAFRHYAGLYPDTCILLVDTYDTIHSGLPNAIKTGLEMKKKGQRLGGIRLDSGDPLSLSRKARQMLDNAGLHHAQIVVSDQLDEHVIASLLQNEAPIDVFGIGTRLVTGYPDAALGGVYKICSIGGRPTMKHTDDTSKSNLPGIKNLLRQEDDNGEFSCDHIVLVQDHAETQSGKLKQDRGFNNTHTENIRTRVMDSGRMLGHPTDIREIGGFSRSRQAGLPAGVKRLSKPDCFDIKYGHSLEMLIKQLTRSHDKRIDRS